jgi:hypothetical protein
MLDKDHNWWDYFFVLAIVGTRGQGCFEEEAPHVPAGREGSPVLYAWKDAGHPAAGIPSGGREAAWPLAVGDRSRPTQPGNPYTTEDAARPVNVRLAFSIFAWV